LSPLKTLNDFETHKNLSLRSTNAFKQFKSESGDDYEPGKARELTPLSERESYQAMKTHSIMIRQNSDPSHEYMRAIKMFTNTLN
jgi:hypothetical protein